MTTLRPEYRRLALILVDFMLRRGIREIEGRSAPPAPGRRTRWFVHDRQTGTGTGHRLPPKAGPEIVRAANRLAAVARRAPLSRRIGDGGP